MNFIDRLHTGLVGTPARSLATLFGALLVNTAELPTVVKDIIIALAGPLM